MTLPERLVDDVQRYGLIVAPIAARLLEIHPQRARRLLEGLVRGGALRRFRFDGASYFAAGPRPLSVKAVRAAFAVSWFCHMGDSPGDLLPPTAVLDLISPVTAELGLPRPLAVPAYLNRRTRRLSVFVLGPAGNGSPSVFQARRHLERFVTKRWFRPYLALIEAGHGELTFLHPGEVAGDALVAALRDAPILSRVHRPAVIPVQVAPLVTLTVEPRKDKSPEGAFVLGC